MSSLLLSAAAMFRASAQNYKAANRKTITNKNPHNFNKYTIGGVDIYAVNEESARAQYDRMMKKKAMRLQKSLAKENK